MVEWKGPHRVPGDDVIPADLRIDHVYIVSCKYLSSVLLNAGPQRLFDRLLVGEGRSNANWFGVCAPKEFQRYYEASLRSCRAIAFPARVGDLSRAQQKALRSELSSRSLPISLVQPWSDLCAEVSTESARRWNAAITSKSAALRLLWRMLRISDATYFVLGADKTVSLRIRVGSAWDWVQAYDLRDLEIRARQAGQPEVGWVAHVVERATGSHIHVRGHVEVRWGHGRFVGSPEAKVYLDTPHLEVPGYHRLV
jgi:hypothetical protein